MCFFDCCWQLPEEEIYKRIDANLEEINKQFSLINENSLEKMKKISQSVKKKKHNASNQYRNYYQ